MEIHHLIASMLAFASAILMGGMFGILMWLSHREQRRNARGEGK